MVLRFARGKTSFSALQALLRDYDRDPAARRKRIALIAQEQPEVFFRAAVDFLEDDLESGAAGCLIGLLLAGKPFARALSRPGQSRDQAVALARQAMRVDPAADVLLAGEIAEASLAPPGPGTVEYLMEILQQVSDGRRILPALMRVLRSPDQRVRSKAVLMIGRGTRRPHWIANRLEEPDLRVAANAVESLWGVRTPEARRLFEAASRSSQNRIAGNGLLGLYWVGEITALRGLIAMAGHAAPLFRRTAAWAMGQTGDPRFHATLASLLGDQTGARRQALAALQQIRRSVAQIRAVDPWLLAARFLESDAQTGERRVAVAVVSTEGAQFPAILPVQFQLNESGRTVWSYRVTERPAPAGLSVIFLFPQSAGGAEGSWESAARRCAWKRPSDIWLPTAYARGGEPGVPDFWSAFQRILQPGPHGQRTGDHIIVLAPEETGEIPAGVPSALAARRIPVQIVSAVSNAALEELCRRSGGHFYSARDPAEIESGISQAYLNLLARYEIRYRPESVEGALLQICAQTPSGWGETVVR